MTIDERRRDRALCVNCDHWREEHYNADGSWRGNELEPACVEFFGANPDAARANKREKETAYLTDESADIATT